MKRIRKEDLPDICKRVKHTMRYDTELTDTALARRYGIGNGTIENLRAEVKREDADKKAKSM